MSGVRSLVRSSGTEQGRRDYCHSILIAIGVAAGGHDHCVAQLCANLVGEPSRVGGVGAGRHGGELDLDCEYLPRRAP